MIERNFCNSLWRPTTQEKPTCCSRAPAIILAVTTIAVGIIGGVTGILALYPIPCLSLLGTTGGVVMALCWCLLGIGRYCNIARRCHKVHEK